MKYQTLVYIYLYLFLIGDSIFQKISIFGITPFKLVLGLTLIFSLNKKKNININILGYSIIMLEILNSSYKYEINTLNYIYYIFIGFFTLNLILVTKEISIEKYKAIYLKVAEISLLIVPFNLKGYQLTETYLKKVSFVRNGEFVPRAFFGNENDYATFLVFALQIVLEEKTKKNYLISIMILFTIYLTQSRLSLILGVFVLVKSLKLSSKKKLWFGFSIIILIIFKMDKVYQFINSLVDNSNMVRIRIYLETLNISLQNFWSGIGRSNLNKALLERNINPANPHNVLLEIWSSYGIVVLLYFLMFIIRGLLNKKSRDYTILYVLLSVGPSSYIYQRWQWYILGIILLMIKNKSFNKTVVAVSM
ncbi:MAG: O-antigen ligase family protein [Cetobacterium sp.]